MKYSIDEAVHCGEKGEPMGSLSPSQYLKTITIPATSKALKDLEIDGKVTIKIMGRIKRLSTDSERSCLDVEAEDLEVYATGQFDSIIDD